MKYNSFSRTKLAINKQDNAIYLEATQELLLLNCHRLQPVEQ